MDWLTYRTIRDELDASASIEKLTLEYERFDQQWLGFSWFLCRCPEKSLRKSLNDKTYRLMHRAGDAKFGLVDISAVYTFDDHEVQLFDVQAWVAKEIDV